MEINVASMNTLSQRTVLPLKDGYATTEKMTGLQQRPLKRLNHDEPVANKQISTKQLLQ